MPHPRCTTVCSTARFVRGCIAGGGCIGVSWLRTDQTRTGEKGEVQPVVQIPCRRDSGLSVCIGCVGVFMSMDAVFGHPLSVTNKLFVCEPHAATGVRSRT